MSARRALRFATLALFAFVAPVVVHAQMGGIGGGIGGRGGMGGRGGGMGGMGRGGMQGVAARLAEPMINSVDLILKHGTELALTDTQVTRLTRVKATQDSSLAQLQARLDSLGGGRRAQGPDGGGDFGAGQARMQERGEAMLAYRDALKHGREAAFAVLEKKQRKRASKLEKQLKHEMEQAERGQRGGFDR